MEPRDYLRLLRRRGLVIVLLVAIGLAGAFAYTQRQTKVYGSSITFFLSDSSGRPVNPLIAESAQTRFASYALLASSPPVRSRVQAEAPQRLLNVSANGVPKTIFMKLDVQATSPQDAYTLARAYGDVLPKYVSGFEGTSNGDAGTTLAVLSAPVVNPELLSPKKSRNLGVGGAAGLVLGLALVALWEALDTRLRKTEDLVSDTDLTLLASVPRELRKETLVVKNRPQSKRAEAIRYIRANLQFAEMDQPFRVLVVTSAVAGEGKTSVATDLALACAEAGQRVVLVDADLRRPRVAAAFDIAPAPGLTSHLTKQVALSDALRTIEGFSLRVLPSGERTSKPSEQLSSAAMGAALRELADDSDLVIVDSAPLLPVADTSGLLAHADAVVLVTKMGVTTRGQARNAAVRLRTFQARILGVVANGAKRESAYGDYRGYAADPLPRTTEQEGQPVPASTTPALVVHEAPAAAPAPAPEPATEPEPQSQVSGGWAREAVAEPTRSEPQPEPVPSWQPAQVDETASAGESLSSPEHSPGPAQPGWSQPSPRDV